MQIMEQSCFGYSREGLGETGLDYHKENFDYMFKKRIR